MGILVNKADLGVSDVVIRGCDDGGIWAFYGSLTITDSELSNNDSERGTIYAQNSNVAVLNCSFVGNRSQGGGGAINASYGGSLTIIDSRIVDNSANDLAGGGIYCERADSLTIRNSLISGNSANTDGGGIWAYADTMIIEDCTISHNRAGEGGGGAHLQSTNGLLARINILGNSAGMNGGGLRTDGSFTIADSSICNNSVTSYGAYAGGIGSRDTLRLINSTVSGNESTGSGGGIGGSNLEIINSTITENRSRHGAAIFVGSSATALLVNSVVAGNTVTEESNADVSGDFDPDSHHNVIGIIDGSTGLNTGPGTQWGTADNPLDPMLRPLAYHGGPTPVHLPLFGSPLLDAGDDASAVDSEGEPLETDQRGDGYSRNLGAAVDIGAVEGMQGF